MTEKEKMLSGKIYDPSDEELAEERRNAHRLCKLYNSTIEEETMTREHMLAALLPNRKNNVFLQGPIYFDYGINTSLGENVYANFNFTVLDVCPVIIEDNVFFGPNVSILTPIHPLRYQERNPKVNSKGIMTDDEYAAPITIKKNTWIAGNVTICGGVTIGEGCVIGAGSVVTRSIPDNYLAYGNPCKPIRLISEEDSIKLKKNLY